VVDVHFEHQPLAEIGNPEQFAVNMLSAHCGKLKLPLFEVFRKSKSLLLFKFANA
jgi:hypothetical protein